MVKPKNYRTLPAVVDKTSKEINTIIQHTKESDLSEEEKTFLVGCVELATWLPQAVEEKNITIRQLQKLIFGCSATRKSKSNKDNQVPPEDNKEPDVQEKPAESSKNDDIGKQDHPDEANAPKINKNLKGHGRHSHEKYSNATHINMEIEGLIAGDSCPALCGGKLYFLKKGIFVRITGNPIGTVTKYHLDKLRCALCGLVITASLPEGVPREKYDSLFKANLCVNKYYIGTPFFRQAQLQSFLDFPLAPSTQYDLVEKVADGAYPAFKALEKIAAQAELVHNDDTSVKILDVMKDNKNNPDKKRTGMYTTGIIAKTVDQTIALYYSGIQHAGENLQDLLNKRIENAGTVIQMSDASSMNLPGDFKVILCNCLDHAFRKFKDLIDYFPEPCGHIMNVLAKIYQNDVDCKTLSAQDRLIYHKKESLPLLIDLKKFLEKQFSDKLVEPNSHVGKSIQYLLNHWDKLIRFTQVAGCPISNAIVERMLKIPIRVRKSAMFYKTQHGACIGGILTSLIQTAILAEQNPLDYLVALQDHYHAVRQNPAVWLPWNFKKTLQSMDQQDKQAA